MPDPYWDEIIEPAPGSYASFAGLRMTRRQIYEETTGRPAPRAEDEHQGLLQTAPWRPVDPASLDIAAGAKRFLQCGFAEEKRDDLEGLR